ncbi:hypothetical protein P4B35_02295 [Pontiellaceae bacterium B12227]|nr:hypothetical protein [Pontiellaceae bacterium B12227]
MGTSASYGGNRDKKSLLPDWAFPSGDGESSNSPDSQPESSEESGEENENPQGDVPNPETEGSDTSNEPPPLWQAAKASMTRGVRADGPGGGGGMPQTGRSYVKAKGGSRVATVNASAGRAAAQRITGFLSSVASDGVNAALQNLGLSRLIGSDVDTVYAELLDSIAPESSGFDESLARQAMEDALSLIYENTEKLDDLDHLSSGDVLSALERFIAGYIYRQWLQELGISIEKNAVSETQAVSLERNVKAYVNDAVKLEMEAIDPLAVDWAGSEGKAIIQGLYEEAYSIIGGEA